MPSNIHIEANHEWRLNNVHLEAFDSTRVIIWPCFLAYIESSPVKVVTSGVVG